MFANFDALVHSCAGRTYAITGKKRWIAGILYTIFAVQFILGIYMTIRAAVKPGQYFLYHTHLRPDPGT